MAAKPIPASDLLSRNSLSHGTYRNDISFNFKMMYSLPWRIFYFFFFFFLVGKGLRVFQLITKLNALSPASIFVPFKFQDLLPEQVI